MATINKALENPLTARKPTQKKNKLEIYQVHIWPLIKLIEIDDIPFVRLWPALTV